ncbi:MAG: hypothetical protein WA869_23605 [Alloacidobacterium sp.]|jgi:hypothetical protein
MFLATEELVGKPSTDRIFALLVEILYLSGAKVWTAWLCAMFYGCEVVL